MHKLVTVLVNGLGFEGDVKVVPRFECTLMPRSTQRNDKDQQTLKLGTHIAASTKQMQATQLVTYCKY